VLGLPKCLEVRIEYTGPGPDDVSVDGSISRWIIIDVLLQNFIVSLGPHVLTSMERLHTFQLFETNWEATGYHGRWVGGWESTYYLNPRLLVGCRCGLAHSRLPFLFHPLPRRWSLRFSYVLWSLGARSIREYVARKRFVNELSLGGASPNALVPPCKRLPIPRVLRVAELLPEQIVK
jgi:hypothetical protein